jgi:hypothetical protein
MKDLGPPWPPARSLRLGERDLLGIHCCLGSFSEERPMDTWPWKTACPGANCPAYIVT